MGIYYFKDTCLDFLTYFLPSEASKGVYPPCAGLLFGLSDWILVVKSSPKVQYFPTSGPDRPDWKAAGLK